MSTSKSSPVLIESHDSAFQIHHAGWIVADENTVIQNGFLEVENNKIIRISAGRPKGRIVDHGPGILIPPLVNAHLHLELSALKNMLPYDKGFKHWIQRLLKERGRLGENHLKQAAVLSVKELVKSGVGYVGDISTLGITQDVLENSLLNGVCFHEFLGTQADGFRLENKEGISLSLAGHAPHSTSSQLLSVLKEKTRRCGLPFSMHLAESEDESIFIRDQKGDWADFLASRGIDVSDWKICGKTPVEHINSLGILDADTIAVHLLNADRNDLQIIAKSKAHVCICPRSNTNLHGRLPDISTMISFGIFPALGTDSLASCGSLDIFDEMSFIARHYPDLPCEKIFSMGTINGARALKLDSRTGSLTPGKKAQFVYLPVDVKNKKNIFQDMMYDE